MQQYLLLVLTLVVFISCNTPSTNSNTDEASTPTTQTAATETTPEATIANTETTSTPEAVQTATTETATPIETPPSKPTPKTVTTPKEKPVSPTKIEPTTTEVPTPTSVEEKPETTTPAVVTTKPEQPIEEAPEPIRATPPSHAAFDALLKKYVSRSGQVNYKGIKADKAKLNSYAQLLSDNPPQADWTKYEKEAYWINVYNAYTLKLIVDNYPTSSITKLKGGKPWDVKWIKIGDKTYSLNNVENDIIRPRFKDANIHFAVNCAAQSCPPLHNGAWTGENVRSLGRAKAKAFINNSKYNTITADAVEVSKIFEWYAVDFGDLITFLNKYSDTPINPDAKISYKEYDWSLNE